MLRSDNFSLLQASIVTIAEPSLPLLISSPQRLTAWWCRFMCILFRVWLLHLRSMCRALSDPPHKGQVAEPVEDKTSTLDPPQSSDEMTQHSSSPNLICKVSTSLAGLDLH